MAFPAASWHCDGGQRIRITHKLPTSEGQESAGKITHDNAGTMCHRLLQDLSCAILLLDHDPAPWPYIQVLTCDVISLSLPFGEAGGSARGLTPPITAGLRPNPWLSQQGSAKRAPLLKGVSTQ